MVAPFTGAWIEIDNPKENDIVLGVAPFTGAWIEIQNEFGKMGYRKRRSLHGSVD